jgi:hypothetical protein
LGFKLIGLLPELLLPGVELGLLDLKMGRLLAELLLPRVELASL